jgi:transcription initiation factor TFIID subunit 11
LRKEAEKQNEDMARLLSDEFSEAQQDRYEAYKRSKLKQPKVRKVMNSVTGLDIHKNALYVAQSSAKLYVGELTELARTVMDERGEVGAIRPWHLREAYLRLEAEGKTPSTASVAPHLFNARRSII